ncbi:MAG: xanthine dehydrogenase family protein molybdopterin-binding subunit, partial [Anaerolineae bacterium]
METRYFGERIKRNEDPRLLTGQALFTDDVDLQGMAQAAFMRSPHAHARILSVDVSMALEREGVLAVYTAVDLGDYWQPGPLLVSPPPVKDIVFNQRTQVPLAKDKVVYVGEPVAIVIAESRYIAEDAAEEVWVDYEPLPPVVDMEAALSPDTAVIHEDIGSNVAAHVVQVKGDGARFDEIAQEAALVVERRFYYDH